MMFTQKLIRVAANIVALIMLTVILGGAITCGVLRVTKGHEYALRNAKKFAEQVPGVSFVWCEIWDKDANGRLDCLLFRGYETPMRLVCDGWSLFDNQGCDIR